MNPKLSKGIDLFNNGCFHESHDVLEELWSECDDEYKELYQGMIQAAVSLYLIQQNRLKGANKVYKRAIINLGKYKNVEMKLSISELISDLNNYFLPFEHWNEKESLTFSTDYPKIKAQP